MSDIDLIPQAYRVWRWQLRWIKNAAFVLAGLVGLLMLAAVALGIATEDSRSRVGDLQRKRTDSAQQQVDLQRLGEAKVELERQFRLLSGLRSGAAAGDMFVTIDRALTGNDVWFLDWQFQRAGVMVGEGIEAVDSGYFIPYPDNGEQLAADDLRVQTNMTIRGQSLDHSALSGFVRRLFVQPEIDDVRIRRTSLVRLNQADAVDFELAVVLTTEVSAE